MLRVEVIGTDGHTFTIEIDSVLELPKKGDSILCGKCKEQTIVQNVGFPYRPADNGKSQVNDQNQQTLIK